MRKRVAKILAFLLVFCMALPMFGSLTVQAAEPALNAKSLKAFIGTNYQLALKNVDDTQVKSKTWKANRTSIAKVDQNGLVTPVAVGTTTIKCTLAMKDGTSKVLSCSVTVKKRIACTGMTITNKKLDKNNTQTLYVGEKFTIKKKPTPSKTTDSVFWISYDEDVATVASGVVTAKKEGIAVIEVRAGVTREDAMRADNTAVDRLYINVTKKPVPTPTPTSTPTPSPTPTPTPTPLPAPQVESVSMVGSQELQITFNTPVKKSSLISNGKLVSGTVILGKDEGAIDFGTLTPVLSGDATRLTLTGSGSFSGTYSVVVSDKVLSQTDKAFEQYAEVLKLKDTTGPVYIGTEIGYTGWTSNIRFNEAVDISGMTIDSVSGVTDAVLVNYLKDPNSYTLSDDKKSLVVNLQGITDNKALVAVISIKGLKDVSGNATTPLKLTGITVRTNAVAQANAEILSAKRVAKSELEVQYSKAIENGGYATFGTGTSQQISLGIVDTTDRTIVRYDIPSAFRSATGMQAVKFSGWSCYNYNNLTQAETYRGVDFTLDTSLPQLKTAELANGTYESRTAAKLTLTYDKVIANAVNNPVILARVKTTNGEISTIYPTAIRALVEEDTVTYMFTEPILMEDGEFVFTLPAAMVWDKLDNYSAERTITVRKAGAANDELPAPTKVEQGSTDKSVVNVAFANKLDFESAENIANYYVINNLGTRVYPVSARIAEQNSTKAVVELEFPTGTFTETAATYELVVRGVKGYNNSFSAMSEYSVLFTATENTPPMPKSIKLNGSTIVMNMSETVTGTIKVTATDASGQTIQGEGYTSGNVIYVALTKGPNMLSSKVLSFMITDNQIYDANGNKADLKTTTSYIAIME